MTSEEHGEVMKGKKVKCLGWCGGTLVSNDPGVRYCKQCRKKRDHTELSARDERRFIGDDNIIIPDGHDDHWFK